MKLSNDIMCIWLYGGWVYVFQIRLEYLDCWVDGWFEYCMQTFFFFRF